jgi:hypothetical protein
MNATTKILALACAGLLALAGTASAHHGNSAATVYGAKLAGAAPTATTDPTTAIGGKAILVDGSQNNVLAVKVRNLKPNTAYTFAVVNAPDFAPTTATTNEDGKLRGFVKSATFNAVAGTTYTVQVKEGDTVVASGDLQPIQFKKRFGHRHKHGFGRHHHHGGFQKSGREAAQAESGDPGHDCNDGERS